MNKINKLAGKINELAEDLKDLQGLISFEVYPFGDKVDVHMDKEAFCNTFATYWSRDRKDEDYPIELFVEVGGVKFFALSETQVPFGEAI